jgi:hypothetical protein
MNGHQIDRRILLIHLHAVEEKFPLRFVGLLDSGTATHVFGDEAVSLLAEKRNGLDLWDVGGAETDLSDRLGRPVGIIVRSELHGRDKERVLAGLKPL